jgi:uncharacterized RDD family membrane protein YckC
MAVSEEEFMDWYYAIGEAKQGPVGAEKMRELVETGFIGPDTPVWSPDLPAWMPLRNVGEPWAITPSVAVLESEPEAQVAPADLPGDASGPADDESTEPSPWRRWLARWFDIWIFALVFAVVAFSALEITSPRLADALFETNDALFGLFVVAALIPIEALLLSSHGTTPGKWIFGIRVMPVEGGRPTYATALRRAMLVWWRGLAIGFPIVTLFTQAHAYSKLKGDGETTWDRDTGLRVLHRPMSGGQIALAVGVGLTLLVIYTFLNAYGASGY